MFFAHPLLLLFLPLAAAPVLLHLLTLHKLSTIELSTFRFLMESHHQQRRRLKLLEWLVMLLRVLFVLGVVAMLSRPVLRRFGGLFGGGDGARDVAIVMDCGAAMDLRSAGKSSLERAKASAAALLAVLREGDHVTLIRAGRRAETLARGPAGRPDHLRQQIEALATDPATADLPAAFDAVAQLPARGPRVVYVFTDLQRRAWTPLGTSPALAAFREEGGARTVLMDVGAADPVRNVGVVGEPPGGAPPVVGLPVVLRATVRNFGAQRTEARLAVVVDEQQAGQHTIPLEPGERVTQAVVVTPRKAGVLRGRFELPGDDFTTDDRFQFCLNVSPRIKVLLVAGPREPRTMDRQELYIRAALRAPLESAPKAAAAPAAGDSAAEQRLAAAIQVDLVREDQWDERRMDESDVVVLAGVRLDAARGAMLRRHLRGGGGVLMFPHPGATAESQNAALFAPGPAPGTGGAAGPALVLAAPVGNLDDASRAASVGGAETGHPVMAAFAREGADEAGFFATARVFRRFPLVISLGEEPGAKADGGADAGARWRAPAALLRLADRSPLWAEVSLGEGKLIVSGVPASPGWSDLPLKPEFVPMLLRAVTHLRRAAPASAWPAIRPGEPAPLSLTDAWPRAQAQGTGPLGDDAARATVELHRAGRRLEGAFEGTQRLGQYAFQVTPNAGDAPARADLGFAVNLEPEHADFQRLPPAELERMFAPARPTLVSSVADDPLLIEQLTSQREIWRALIWAALAVMAVEFVLATLGPSKGKARQAGSVAA